MTEKRNIADFWWFNNTTCWRIQIQGRVDYYLYLPTMKYLYQPRVGEWHGTKELRMSITDERKYKVKTFKNETEALNWFTKTKRIVTHEKVLARAESARKQTLDMAISNIEFAAEILKGLDNE